MNSRAQRKRDLAQRRASRFGLLSPRPEGRLEPAEATLRAPHDCSARRPQPDGAPTPTARPNSKTTRATANASIRSDLPRSRLERRELAISRVDTRTTRSPRAIRNRLREPKRAGSPPAPTPVHHPEPEPTAAPDRTRREPTPTVLSPSISPVPAPMAAMVCELLCMSAPRTNHPLVPFFSRLKWTAGGHGLLRAVPRTLSVTPDIPDRRRAKTTGSQALARPTASMRVSSPPVGTIPSASDVTDEAITTASLIAIATIVERGPVRELVCGRRRAYAPDATVGPSGASVVRPQRLSEWRRRTLDLPHAPTVSDLLGVSRCCPRLAGPGPVCSAPSRT